MKIIQVIPTAYYFLSIEISILSAASLHQNTKHLGIDDKYLAKLSSGYFTVHHDESANPNLNFGDNSLLNDQYDHIDFNLPGGFGSGMLDPTHEKSDVWNLNSQQILHNNNNLMSVDDIKNPYHWVVVFYFGNF